MRVKLRKYLLWNNILMCLAAVQFGLIVGFIVGAGNKLAPLMLSLEALK